jgi:hypothetical protein
MNPEFSRNFVQKLSFLAVLWLALGMYFTHADDQAFSAFLKVYFVILLDLVFLILLFWSLFFPNPARRGGRVRALIFFTFKLACLGLFAITLKRVRSAPTYAVVIGLLFIAVGPMLAGVLSQIQKGNPKRAAKF